MINYNLQLKYDPSVEEESNGNFSVTKEYKVDCHTPIKQAIKGIIIQYVKKTSKVTEANGRVHNTTEDINNLTSGNVKYSNDAYFEIFDLEQANNSKNKKKTAYSKNADAFQNNALVQYENYLYPYTYDDITDPEYEIYKTKGEINVVGENCFISEDNPNYAEIIGLTWTDDPDTPANGLLYIPYNSDVYNLIFSSTNSNILVHNVNVTWSWDDPRSVVTSSVTLYKNIVIGGKNLKKKKSKRKNYTIKRNKKKFTRKIYLHH